MLQKDVTRQLEISRKAFETDETTGWGNPERFLLPDQRRLLESLVKQAVLSIEVEYTAERDIRLQPD